MQGRRLKRLGYHIRHTYFTMNTMVVIVALAIAIGWAWASVGVLQKNFVLERRLDDKRKQQRLVELQTENLAYEQRYYKSDEYLALEAKRRLGLADPGERVLMLPPNSAAARSYDLASADMVTRSDVAAEAPSELQQWLNFLFGSRQS